MTQIYQHKRSATPTDVPTYSDLAFGEIAVNTADAAAYVRNEDDEIIDISRPTLGRILQSGATTGQFIKWNGSAWAGASFALSNLPAGGGFAGQYLVYNGTAWAPASLDVPLAIIGQDGATAGQVAMWNDAEGKWEPTSLYPSNINQASATTGQVITWGSLGWAPASIPYPVHTSSQSFPSANVDLTNGSQWYTVTSLTLAAGTWLVMATATFVRGGSGTRSFALRIASSSTHYASSQQGMATVSGNTVETSCSAVITLASSTTINMQGATNTTSSPADYAAYTESIMGTTNASGLVAVRIA